jgi:hypothetical protein
MDSGFGFMLGDFRSQDNGRHTGVFVPGDPDNIGMYADCPFDYENQLTAMFVNDEGRWG